MGAGALALSILGAGVASADDGVVGQYFKDAKSVLAQRGMSAVVATTVGDRKDWDDCIVTSATPAAFTDGYGEDQGNQMLVNLNCYSNYATGQRPGFSIQSKEGQENYQQDVAAQQEREAQQRAAQEQAELEELEGGPDA